MYGSDDIYIAWLQWGRDLSITELTFLDGGPSASVELQWGRDLSITEFGVLFYLRSPGKSLQWGRDLSITELLCRLAAIAHRRRASMGP